MGPKSYEFGQKPYEFAFETFKVYRGYKKFLDFVLAMVIWQEKDFHFCDTCQNITCNLHDFYNYLKLQFTTISQRFWFNSQDYPSFFTKNKLLHHIQFYFKMDFDPLCSVHSPGSSKTTPLRLRTPPPPPYTSTSLTAAGTPTSRQLTTSTKQKEQQ